MRKAFLQLHIAVFLAGFTGILGRLIHLNEGMLVWYRLLLSVAALALVLFLKKKLNAISRIDLLKTAGVGLLIALHWVAFYGSIKYANVSVALVCFSATGFFTSLFEPLVHRTRINLIEVLLGLMAIVGIYIIFDFHPQYKTGIIFGIIAAIGSGLFPVFNKNLVKRISPADLTLYELSGGLVFLTLFLPFYFLKFPPAYLIPTFQDVCWLIVLAILCTVISFELQLKALKKVSAFTANLSYNLEPLYGILMAFVIFGENKSFHKEFYIGAGLILLSILLQTLRIVWQHQKGSVKSFNI
ncbi:MAG TPA: DMT family transporter [Ferruginibacter sp.]|nr:DMT family transporter [Ferruginibacter sp.]